MAETVHLFLKANGAEIHGESSQINMGRQNSIECLYFEHSVQTSREAGSGLATGRRQYSPILIRKRVDKSTPLLMKAMAENQDIEGILKFYRPNPTGDGTIEQYYTIRFTKSRVVSIRHYRPEAIAAGTDNLFNLEEIGFIIGTINWTYTNGGVMYQDTTIQKPK